MDDILDLSTIGNIPNLKGDWRNWSVAEKKLYAKYQFKFKNIKDIYKYQMLELSKDFEFHRKIESLSRKDCQSLYNERKEKIDKDFDRQQTVLDDWLEKKQKELKELKELK